MQAKNTKEAWNHSPLPPVTTDTGFLALRED